MRREVHDEMVLLFGDCPGDQTGPVKLCPRKKAVSVPDEEEEVGGGGGEGETDISLDSDFNISKRSVDSSISKRSEYSSFAKRSEKSSVAKRSDKSSVAKRSDKSSVAKRSDKSSVAKRSDKSSVAKRSDKSSIAKRNLESSSAKPSGKVKKRAANGEGRDGGDEKESDGGLSDGPNMVPPTPFNSPKDDDLSPDTLLSWKRAKLFNVNPDGNPVKSLACVSAPYTVYTRMNLMTAAQWTRLPPAELEARV